MSNEPMRSDDESGMAVVAYVVWGLWLVAVGGLCWLVFA